MFWYILKYPNIGGNHNYQWVALRYASCIDTVLGLQTTCTSRHGNRHGASCSMLHVVCDRRCMCRRCLRVHMYVIRSYWTSRKVIFFVLLSSVWLGLWHNVWTCGILTVRRLYKLTCELTQLERRMVQLNSEVGLLCLCFHRSSSKQQGEDPI